MQPKRPGHFLWRDATCAAGGLLAASAAAFAVLPSGSVAQSATFESRWQAISPGQKSDRMDEPRRRSDSKLYFFDLPTVRTTVVVKGQQQSNEPRKETDGVGDRNDSLSNGSMNRIPTPPVRVRPVDGKAKDKLPIGCESSFSPVTVPAMAHVSARCLS